MTIDERVEDAVGVVAAAWPNADEFGLLFPDQIEPAWFSGAELQDAVDAFRRRARQVERPIRIGDTFWVRGFSTASPTDWDDLRDITSQARAMTKAAAASALLGRVAPQAEEQDIAAEGPAGPTPAPAAGQPPGGVSTARPAI